jgi:hypothetical protein
MVGFADDIGIPSIDLSEISLFCHFPGILNKRRKKENPER